MTCISASERIFNNAGFGGGGGLNIGGGIGGGIGGLGGGIGGGIGGLGGRIVGGKGGFEPRPPDGLDKKLFQDADAAATRLL